MSFTGTSLELRSINRNLRKEGKRMCSDCSKVFDDIERNFHVKRYHGEVPAFEVRCKPCAQRHRAEAKAKRRTNPETYIRGLVSSFKHRALQQGLSFDLDADYLVDLFLTQKGKCYYTGEDLDFTHQRPNRNTAHPLVPSLDKLIPKDGYVKGNVAWCLYKVNVMKTDLNEETFYAACQKIRRRNWE